MDWNGRLRYRNAANGLHKKSVSTDDQEIYKADGFQIVSNTNLLPGNENLIEILVTRNCLKSR
jgi:hypothetical protein